jgi:Holliday junction resolvase
MPYVIKASGEKEKFDKEKIYQSLKKAGAPSQLASEICKEVSSEIREGMKTEEIFQKTLSCLQRKNSILASRYNLKRAIMQLGPTGFPFERFVARILQEYGYQTKVGQKVPGYCVIHEVDVIAKKEKKHFMIECKYHNYGGIKSDLKVALYTFARFLDLKKGLEKSKLHNKFFFHQAWLMTNTKFTTEAIRFAQCQGLKMTGWHYPKKESLNDLIERKKLYPINILPSFSNSLTKKFFQLRPDLILTKDLLGYEAVDLVKTFRINFPEAQKIYQEIHFLHSGNEENS